MRGFSVRHRLASFRYAGQGIATMFRTQHNAWLHAVATGTVVTAGLIVGLSRADWKWLALTITLVWFAEAMNTAFEYLCDVVSPDHSDAVKHAKDIAAGAVLICALGAVVQGGLIFAPHL